MANRLPPLSLYIHTPWCVRKCPYCDFNSHEPESGANDLPEAAYLAALLSDLDGDLALASGRTLQTIFIGGGTPSLLSPTFIDSYSMAFVSGSPFRLALKSPWKPIQARPSSSGSLVIGKPVSIDCLWGVQSFRPTQLSALGRIHTGNEAVTAIGEARAAGFDNLNIDLMHGLPPTNT